MALWLFKEEPEHYSYSDLEREGSTTWDGVKNNLARINLRKVCRGDRIWYYHSGKEKAIVGEMHALGDAEETPRAGDPKAVAVKVGPVRRLPRPVSLAEVKKDPALGDWILVRFSRLSVMPVTATQWRRVEELSRSKD